MRFITTPPIRAAGPRAMAFFIALALQISFLLLLIQAIERARPLLPKPLGREFILILRRPSLPARPDLAPPSRYQAPVITRPEVAPPLAMPPGPQAVPLVPPSSLKGFGQALNNCAPENYANLPEERKALCARPGEGVAVQQAPNLMGSPSHVENNDYWSSQLAQRNTPARVDCTHMETQSLGPAKQGFSVIADPLCAFHQLLQQLEH